MCVKSRECNRLWEGGEQRKDHTFHLVSLVSGPAGHGCCESSQGQPTKAGELMNSHSFGSHHFQSITYSELLAEHFLCVRLWTHVRVANRSGSYSCGISLPRQRHSHLDITNEWGLAKCLLCDGWLVVKHIPILCLLDFSILDDSCVFQRA